MLRRGPRLRPQGVRALSALGAAAQRCDVQAALGGTALQQGLRVLGGLYGALLTGTIIYIYI